MEYLPVLNRLRAYKPTAYQRYQIDLYLERYTKALENIALMDEYIDEAVALIRRHHLFAKAISLYKNTAHYSVRMEVYLAQVETDKWPNMLSLVLGFNDL